MIGPSSGNFGICSGFGRMVGCAFPRLFSNGAIRRKQWLISCACFMYWKKQNLGLLPDAVVIKEEVNKLADIYFDDVSECFMGCLMIIIYDVPERRDGSLVSNYSLTGSKMTSIVESSQINLRFFISNPIISLFTVHDPSLTVSQRSQPVYDVSRLYPLSYQLVFPLFVLLPVILHIGTVPPANNNDCFAVAKIHPALTSSTSLKFFHKITKFHLKIIFLHNRTRYFTEQYCCSAL